jgi:hypothetical protein
MKKIFLAIFLYTCINLANASSAMYVSEITAKNFIVKNAASEIEAADASRKQCEEYSGIEGSCSLMFKTEYGGYAAVAKGIGVSGLAYGKTSQDRADKLAMKACLDGSSKPETCRIVARYFDNGRKVRMYVPINQ